MENAKHPSSDLYTKVAGKLTSDEVLIGIILDESVSWKPKSLERLVLGIGNEVYRVVHPENQSQNLILRIHHGEHPGFYFEAWAMQEVAKYGVLVPEVLKINTKIYEGKTVTYCVLQELRGEPLSSLLDRGLSQDEKEHYALLAGETLAKIHQVQTQGFGHFKKNGVGQYSTITESMRQDADIEDLLNLAHAIDLSEQTVLSAVSIVHATTTKETPHLIHVDYAPKHLFVADGLITGVIDFEIAMSGIAATDFNRWRSQDDRISMTNLMRGYENIQRLPEDFWETMLAVQVHSALRTMLYHFRTTNELSEVRRAGDELYLLLERKTSLKS